MAKRIAYRKKRQNRFSMFLAAIVVLMLMVVVAVGSISLKEKLAEYQQAEQALVEQIAIENERKVAIEEQEKYTHTNKYVEEMARKKLGLVYEDEIIFRQDE
ncbi:MAG: septum formation initiator family protein [Lachnospiraceae bacterium]|jgi:cell division protein FtsB|nr:septum formation initiator family protein [Lachnospiraceae bacterium]